ncbi:tetratricopeptide repeat protein [Mycobacterium sp. PDNC021]|uniref:tetratricopeptide repeat protein n=1 Tax=Mycobacterium sp. PDNC021 TaxID=3391399 RepID=UPI003AABD840
MSIFVLTQPFALTGIHGAAASGVGYDDGILLGSAIRLIHGDLPYSSFLLLHPPGMSVLMSPVAAVGAVAGSSTALILARVVTLLVAIANAVLVAAAVRRRGPVASLAAGVLFALFPLAINATHTLLLAPYTVLFCLIGAVLLFGAGRVASPRRILLAGAAFGTACAVDLAAIPVALAAVVVISVLQRQSILRLTASMVGMFVALCLPFFAVAPGRFIDDVVVAPLQHEWAGNASIMFKVRQLAGVEGISWLDVPNSVVIGAAVLLTAGFTYWVFKSRTDFVVIDWFVVAGLMATVAAALVGGQLYSTQAYLPAAFISMAAGSFVGALAKRLVSTQRAALAGLVLAGVLSTGMLVQASAHARALLGGSFNPADVIQAAVPDGSCLVTDLTTSAIVADRFTSNSNTCPTMVDPYGEWIAQTDQHGLYNGTYPTDFVAAFADKLNRADYVALVAPLSSYIPWTPELSQWFLSSFDAVQQTSTVTIYKHVKHVVPPTRFTSFVGMSTGAIIAQGIEAERNGDLGSAFGSYLTAAYRDPGNKFVHFNMGHLYQQRNMIAEAEREYGIALSIDPTFAKPLYNLAVMNSDSNPARAIALYQRVLDLNPDSPAAKFNLGVLMVRSGDADGVSLIRDVVAADPAFAQSVPPDIKLD